ncbi:hypothetical protein BA896_023320 [Janthinobacterium lividum]|uniref:Uncharacterized protein n=1 Tax=Janthinobacterium lividum TaxID=29581 RepID=A0A1E8PMP5_9BURK|nr:hypothetical protein BA896_023320 [Janthinobacterium lividum]
MATAKQNLGKMPCPHCGDPVAVFKSSTGKLSYKCQDADCEASCFAEAHSGVARKWLALLPSRVPEAVPVPEVPPAATLPSKPAPKAGGFTLGGL